MLKEIHNQCCFIPGGWGAGVDTQDPRFPPLQLCETPYPTFFWEMKIPQPPERLKRWVLGLGVHLNSDEQVAEHEAAVASETWMLTESNVRVVERSGKAL